MKNVNVVIISVGDIWVQTFRNEKFQSKVRKLIEDLKFPNSVSVGTQFFEIPIHLPYAFMMRPRCSKFLNELAESKGEKCSCYAPSEPHVEMTYCDLPLGMIGEYFRPNSDPTVYVYLTPHLPLLNASVTLPSADPTLAHCLVYVPVDWQLFANPFIHELLHGISYVLKIELVHCQNPQCVMFPEVSENAHSTQLCDDCVAKIEKQLQKMG